MPSIKLGTMTISVSKNMLLAKLQQLSRIIPSKSTTPIVCNYLFEIKDEWLKEYQQQIGERSKSK